jgi:hypothetical protein
MLKFLRFFWLSIPHLVGIVIRVVAVIVLIHKFTLSSLLGVEMRKYLIIDSQFE